MKRKFNIGDRVICYNTPKEFVGRKGTIKDIFLYATSDSYLNRPSRPKKRYVYVVSFSKNDSDWCDFFSYQLEKAEKKQQFRTKPVQLSENSMEYAEETGRLLREYKENVCFNCGSCDVDKEIKKLCHSLNRVPGIRTFESCCGHEEEPIRIWFTADEVESLREIAQLTDNRYAKESNDDFTCIVEFSDKRGPVFLLQSKGMAEGSYKNGEKLAKEIIKMVRK
jgi:hypothetical protein